MLDSSCSRSWLSARVVVVKKAQPPRVGAIFLMMSHLPAQLAGHSRQGRVVPVLESLPGAHERSIQPMVDPVSDPVHIYYCTLVKALK